MGTFSTQLLVNNKRKRQFPHCQSSSKKEYNNPSKRQSRWLMGNVQWQYILNGIMIKAYHVANFVIVDWNCDYINSSVLCFRMLCLSSFCICTLIYPILDNITYTFTLILLYIVSKHKNKINIQNINNFVYAQFSNIHDLNTLKTQLTACQNYNHCIAYLNF